MAKKKDLPFGEFIEMAGQSEAIADSDEPNSSVFMKIDGYACHECGVEVSRNDINDKDGRFLCKACKFGEETFDTEPPLPREPPVNILAKVSPIYYKDVKIKQINVKVHGLMPEDEKKAIQMIADGVPLAEVADNFGIARSDIAYTNKAK